MGKEKRVEFFKLQASGNDFILIDNLKKNISSFQLRKLAKDFCQRKFGVGADGLLVIELSKKYDFRMHIFNPDGSEAEMCGNGARCVGLWAEIALGKNYVKFDTKAGAIEVEIEKGSLKRDKISMGEYKRVRIKMSEPRGLRLDFPVRVSKRLIKVNCINTGVPHIVVFVEGLDKIDIERIGRKLRFHKAFMPAGTNVDFVEVVDDEFIKIRTYERGVEAETFACGTGVVASAIVTGCKIIKSQSHRYKFDVLTRSGDILQVYFTKDGSKISDVWLKGKAYFVYKGQLNAD